MIVQQDELRMQVPGLLPMYLEQKSMSAKLRYRQ
jgi:hypothetical protein